MNIEDFVIWRSNKIYYGIFETKIGSRISNFEVEFAPVIYDTRKKEFLKYLVLQVKEVNELWFLKECLKGGINP